MSFQLEAARDKPLGLWMMDDNSPFTDYSGNGLQAHAYLTDPLRGIALIKGATYSIVTNKDMLVDFYVSVYNRGQERRPFTLEATVRSLKKDAATDQQMVLGNVNQMDGLVVEGTKVHFVTKYLSTGEARATYDMQVEQAVHLVGVHTEGRNSLYVNGELVASVQITEAQQADLYAHTTDHLWTGQTAGTRDMLINGVAAYNYPLSDLSISRHAYVARDVLDPELVPDIFGGTAIPMYTPAADLFADFNWDNEEDFKQGVLSAVVIENDTLRPQLSNGYSVAGEWRESIALDVYDLATINAVVLDWEGEGVTVQATVNGTTWETVEKGIRLTTIPVNYNPAGKTLTIRVLFSAGVYNSTAFLKSLQFRGYRRGIYEASARTITNLTRVSPEREQPHLLLSDQWGAEYRKGGTTISAEIADVPETIQTVEIWMKVNDTANDFTLVDFRGDAANPATLFRMIYSTNSYGQSSGITRYLNGQTQAQRTTLPRIGEWLVVHIVSSTAVGGRININMNNTGLSGATNGNIQIGQIALYDTALTSTQIKAIVDTYTGNVAQRVGDDSIIAIAEPTEATSLYTHDWSIQAAG